MDNPLKKYVEVEERSDGVYIKVTRAVRDSVTVETLEKVLKDALVTNYDIDAIKDVYSRARGAFEKIGPAFEYYDARLDSYIKITATPQKAFMRIGSDVIAAGIPLSETMIVYGLAQQGILFGVKREMIKEFFSKHAYEQDICIAEGVPPENGQDGMIKYEVNLTPDSTPAVDARGKTNYRDIKSFVDVKKGDVIARLIPPKPGRPGKTVFGADIEATAGKPVALPSGLNTELSTDKTALLAAKDGVVVIQGGNVCVAELLNIEKDVDFSVGNIKYNGDILIKGNVKPGFVIEAEGNIEITGDVEAAKIISRKGAVTIARGVIGRNEAEIRADKGVTVHFAQDCVIKTEGKLLVEKHLMHCKVVCAVFEVVKPSTNVIGGTMILYDFALVGNIGNESNIPTSISIIDKNKNKAKEKLQELENLKKQLEKQIDPVSRELKTKTAILKKAGKEITERQRQELKKYIDLYNNLTMKVKYINQNIEEIYNKMDSVTDYKGYIKVSGTIFPGVVVDLYEMGRKQITGEMRNKVFRLKDCVLQVEG